MRMHFSKIYFLFSLLQYFQRFRLTECLKNYVQYFLIFFQIKKKFFIIISYLYKNYLIVILSYHIKINKY